MATDNVNTHVFFIVGPNFATATRRRSASARREEGREPEVPANCRWSQHHQCSAPKPQAARPPYSDFVCAQGGTRSRFSPASPCIEPRSGQSPAAMQQGEQETHSLKRLPSRSLSETVQFSQDLCSPSVAVRRASSAERGEHFACEGNVWSARQFPRRSRLSRHGRVSFGLWP